MGITREEKITCCVGNVFTDSQYALCLSKNHVYHERSKHIGVKVHYVCQRISA